MTECKLNPPETPPVPVCEHDWILVQSVTYIECVYADLEFDAEGQVTYAMMGDVAHNDVSDSYNINFECRLCGKQLPIGEAEIDY